MGKAQTIGFHISIRPSAVALIFLRVLKKNPVFFLPFLPVLQIPRRKNISYNLKTEWGFFQKKKKKLFLRKTYLFVSASLHT